MNEDTYKIITTIVSLVTYILLIAINVTLHDEFKEVKDSLKDISKEEIVITEKIQEKDPILNYTSIKNYIDKCNIKYPDVAFAIIRIETGNLTNIEGNNLFGMKCAKQRPYTYTSSGKNSHAIYDRWEDSILDYAIFSAIYCRNKSKEEWIEYLAKNYSENENYKQLIKSCL